MIWRKTTTPSIDLSIAHCRANPGNNMFQNPLIKLMKNIGRDGVVDINEGQVLPEWLLNGLDSSGGACTGEGQWSFTYFLQCFDDRLAISRFLDTGWITQALSMHRTNGTVSCFDQRYENLQPFSFRRLVTKAMDQAVWRTCSG